MSRVKNKTFTYVICGCMKQFWYQCGMLMAACGCRIEIKLVT